MGWVVRGWPGPSADGLGPRLAPNRCLNNATVAVGVATSVKSNAAYDRNLKSNLKV